MNELAQRLCKVLLSYVQQLHQASKSRELSTQQV